MKLRHKHTSIQKAVIESIYSRFSVVASSVVHYTPWSMAANSVTSIVETSGDFIIFTTYVGIKTSLNIKIETHEADK